MTTETVNQNPQTTNTALVDNAAAERVVPPVRLAVDELVPHLNKAMNALEAASRKISLEAPLVELVRLRASQLNGCAYCVDMHSGDARKAGESEQRLYALPVWRETPFFTARERAALELTEAATRLTGGEVSDEVFARASAQFGEVELAELIWTITVINAWNRLGATARPWALG
ncbi:MAG: carboxymuconolactone decarboxylase family protein [Actinocrinis sp.]